MKIDMVFIQYSLLQKIADYRSEVAIGINRFVLICDNYLFKVSLFDISLTSLLFCFIRSSSDYH